MLAEERQRLRPLKIDPQELALRFPVLVGPRGAVIHDGQAYAMPPDSVGLAGALHLYPDRVSIVVGRYESTHPRHPAIRLIEPVTPVVVGRRWAPGAAVPLAARAG